MTYTSEIKFCVRYLVEHGVSSREFSVLSGLALRAQTEPEFALVRLEKSDFFTELAEKLRDLWPSGEKDGKFPWRDSVSNLSRRLQQLWKERFPDKTFTIDQCLIVARRYLAQYENNTKYMRTLKYFIMKQKDYGLKDGRKKIFNESIFADMLEGKAEEDAVLNSMDGVLGTMTFGEGELR